MSSPPPAPRQRVRTESQLSRKRLADRTKHRENRQEHKSRLASIEGDIAEIKSLLQNLRLGPQPDLSLGGSATAASTCAAAPGLADSWEWNLEAPARGWDASGSQSSTLQTTKLWAPTPTIQPGLVDCQCGSQHVDRFISIDSCPMTVMYRNQASFASPSSHGAPIPRNPSLPSMLLHRMDENLATLLITGCLRQYKLNSMEQLLSFYLLGYRYIRWKMFPSPDTLRDVPAWLWPTETQLLHPHPVVVDFLPWPRLRDYLSLSGDDDPRHSLDYYFKSLEFAWSGDVPMFAQSTGGQVELSREFEAAVGDLSNWRLGPPWTESFPHLTHLVVTA